MFERVGLVPGNAADAPARASEESSRQMDGRGLWHGIKQGNVSCRLSAVQQG